MNDDIGSSVFRKESRGAWQLMIVIGAIITATVTIVGIDRALATSAATAVVAPIEKRLDDHISSAKAMREVMDGYVREERSFRRTMSKKIDALCRANPKADCPLGDE